MVDRIPMSQCIPRRLYKIGSRNLSFGVYDGNEGFIGIREKWTSKYLFTEYHWDQGPPFGTVHTVIDTGIDLPEDIECIEYVENDGYIEIYRPLFHWLEKKEKELGDSQIPETGSE